MHTLLSIFSCTTGSTTTHTQHAPPHSGAAADRPGLRWRGLLPCDGHRGGAAQQPQQPSEQPGAGIAQDARQSDCARTGAQCGRHYVCEVSGVLDEHRQRGTTGSGLSSYISTSSTTTATVGCVYVCMLLSCFLSDIYILHYHSLTHTLSVIYLYLCCISR